MAKFDIYLDIQSASDNTFRVRPFTLGSEASKFSTGFYSTIIQWVKCLLTVPGTDITDPTYGTALAAAHLNNAGDAQMLEDMAHVSVNTATQKIREYQEQEVGLTDEELLAEVRVLSFVKDNVDSIKVTVELSNVAGNLIYLRLPVDITATRTSL